MVMRNLASRLFGGLILSSALAGAAPAADEAGNFAIKGAGSLSCERFIADWEADGRNMALYAGWMEGYATAMNQNTEGSFDLIPWQSPDTLLGLMRRYCESAEADTRFMDRFVSLLRDMSPLRARQESTASALRRGERGVVVYDTVLEAALRRLSAEGFWNGAVDGGYSDAVARAFARFQQDRGLPETGLPDQRTLATLFFTANPDAGAATP